MYDDLDDVEADYDGLGGPRGYFDPNDATSDIDDAEWMGAEASAGDSPIDADVYFAMQDLASGAGVDIDVGELEFEAGLDVYMYSEDDAGGQTNQDRIDAMDRHLDALAIDPLNSSDPLDINPLNGPMFENEHERNRRLEGTRLSMYD